MRHSSIIAVLLTSVIAACTSVTDMQDSGSVTFEFGTATVSSKASAGDRDALINTAQVAVFDGESQLGYGYAEPGSQAGTVEIAGLPLGKELTCYALANVPRSVKGMSRSDIESMGTSLAEYRSDRIPMYARESRTFTGGDNVLSMKLRRAASKVVVEKVTSAFANDKVAAMPCRVSALYLKSAPGRYVISLTDPAAQTWYHDGGYSDTDSRALGDASPLLSDTGLAGYITGRATYNAGLAYYCCPSSTARTSLVAVIDADGTEYSYEVPLPELRPNTEYVIRELVLRGLDIEEPEDPKLDLSVTIEVLDWDSGEAVSMDY